RHFLLLALVDAGDGTSQQYLAHKLGIDPALVVKLIDDLEHRGALTRARDPIDRRLHRITLTPDGKKLLAAAAAAPQRAANDFTRLIGTKRTELRTLVDQTLGLDPKR